MQDPRTLVTEVNPQPSAPDFALRLSSKPAVCRQDAVQPNASAAPALDGKRQKSSSQSLPPGENRDACLYLADIFDNDLDSRSRRSVAIDAIFVTSVSNLA